MKRALPLLLLSLTACVDAGDDYPELLPTAQVLAEPSLDAGAGAQASTAADQALRGRAAALRARAAALRGPVIEPAFRARMARARHR